MIFGWWCGLLSGIALMAFWERVSNYKGFLYSWDEPSRQRDSQTSNQGTMHGWR